MTDPFAHRGPLLAPSILSADFSRLADDCRDVLAHADGLLHVDVMDGHFVPNLSFGAPVFKWLRKALPDVYLDVHLMIDEPVRYAPDMVKAGANRLTIHIEAPEVNRDPAAAIAAIKQLGVGVGLTLKPDTPLASVEPFLEPLDLVLVMSVEPGFGGQTFRPEQLDKVRRLKQLLRPDQRIEIDGGIDEHTIADARRAGVDWFVAGSAIFGPPDRRAALDKLRVAARV